MSALNPTGPAVSPPPSSSSSSRRYYFGHVFLIGAQRLRILARIAGFKVARVHPNRFSVASVLLGVLYPVLWLTNLWAYQQTRRRYRQLDQAWVRETLREVMALNLNPNILFTKKLFFELQKVGKPDEAGATLVELVRTATG